MNRNPWIARKIAQINSGAPIPEADIVSMRKIIKNELNAKDGADVSLILELIEDRKPEVTAEQARKGIDWLAGQVFTSKGNQRSTAFAQQFSEHDMAVIRECQANPRFQLIELEVCPGPYGWAAAAVFPVYRCHGAGGKSFDYCARAWQSGGNSYITARRYAA